MAITYRIFEAGDERKFVDLWNAVLYRDPISLDHFVRQTLLDPNFSPEGLWLAESGEEPVGFALAVAPGAPGLFAQPPGVGRISGIGALKRFRSQGVEKELLDRATAFLKGRDCRKAVVVAHESYMSGLDREAYPHIIAFLEEQGFQASGYEPVAMGCLLYNMRRPPEVAQSEARFREEGLEARYYDHSFAAALADFFRREFPAWVEFFIRQVTGRNDPDDIVIARHGKKVIGYCQRLEGDHVGPFGVAADYRNRGIGTIMLYHLLDRMREKGYRFAWFGETGRARPYYERAGFTLQRTYVILSRNIEETRS
ncbi:MAG: GNAT family N-acetyltransferase [Armatimonadetes bacterium]|nr:GNAT family N-acetyltransferase [Armatimonadota bacterium]